jgi:hypothetical protein
VKLAVIFDEKYFYDPITILQLLLEPVRPLLTSKIRSGSFQFLFTENEGMLLRPLKRATYYGSRLFEGGIAKLGLLFQKLIINVLYDIVFLLACTEIAAFLYLREKSFYGIFLSIDSFPRTIVCTQQRGSYDYFFVLWLTPIIYRWAGVQYLADKDYKLLAEGEKKNIMLRTYPIR